MPINGCLVIGSETTLNKNLFNSPKTNRTYRYNLYRHDLYSKLIKPTKRV